MGGVTFDELEVLGVTWNELERLGITWDEMESGEARAKILESKGHPPSKGRRPRRQEGGNLMAEWYEPYKKATDHEMIAQALEACSRKDCAHCLYQGKGIKCAQRLLMDAAKVVASSLRP